MIFVLIILGCITHGFLSFKAKSRLIFSSNLHSSLITAAERGNDEGCKALIDKGVNLNMKNKDGRTALMICAEKRNYQICTALIDKGKGMGLQLDSKDNLGNTALLISAYLGRERIAKYIILAGADVNVKNNNWCTALIVTSYLGQENIAKALLDNEAELNVKYKRGNYTALIFATVKDHSKIVLALIKKGAELDIQVVYLIKSRRPKTTRSILYKSY